MGRVPGVHSRCLQSEYALTASLSHMHDTRHTAALAHRGVKKLDAEALQRERKRGGRTERPSWHVCNYV